jgi:(E)-4-hydroxy-3-methylbut-2-enyl-diphosphate synthase
LKIVKDIEGKLSTFNFQPSTKRPVKIAVMGCEVNGPGEAKEADIGIAAGKGSGVLFINGRIVRRVNESNFAVELLKELKKI